MLKSRHMITALALLSGIVAARSTAPPTFLDRALIKHSGSEVTVVANDPIPLLQTISDLRLEYGWQVNWESAPGYSRFDLVDATDPKWRAAHPNAKGVTRPSGGSFTATFPEPKDSSSPAAERFVLSRIIEQYNATDNPGKYILRTDAESRFTVVGTQVRDETGALREVPPYWILL